MLDKIKNLIRKIESQNSDLNNRIIEQNEKILYNQGKILSRLNRMNMNTSLRDSEFSVFSQFGDDGIIQYLVEKVKPEHDFFVEFGVENYLESNTRFLLQNNNWSGLVLDGSKENIDLRVPLVPRRSDLEFVFFNLQIGVGWNHINMVGADGHGI